MRFRFSFLAHLLLQLSVHTRENFQFFFLWMLQFKKITYSVIWKLSERPPSLSSSISTRPMVRCNGNSRAAALWTLILYWCLLNKSCLSRNSRINEIERLLTHKKVHHLVFLNKADRDLLIYPNNNPLVHKPSQLFREFCCNIMKRRN